MRKEVSADPESFAEEASHLRHAVAASAGDFLDGLVDGLKEGLLLGVAQADEFAVVGIGLSASGVARLGLPRASEVAASERRPGDDTSAEELSDNESACVSFKEDREGGESGAPCKWGTSRAPPHGRRGCRSPASRRT